ncbi:hypothetical protein A359_08600 [secondary endosymbiont of Ctenarytaina eucalypti]|uniref:Uncharacterized protein n=1 Tax=secondary endosymbiont of Ctenarytaina eucalypti TaxID=1199245 RepID=J3VTC9_9ENTR|nr:hypothetical protein A359_08600 [secondary endosymbiont of Ctenarytaina eucalypti]
MLHTSLEVLDALIEHQPTEMAGMPGVCRTFESKRFLPSVF